MRTEAAGGWVEFVAEPSGIGRITFHHPASNSLPAAVLAGLAEAVRAAATHPDVRVVVLASHGDRAFCAGASFDELRAISTPEAGLAFFSGFAHVINAMRTCPKFVLARVAGKAVGGGVGLAAAADYAFATSDAAVKLSELAVGIGPFVVGPAVERKMGKAAMTELAIDAASWRSADWARDRGLYASVAPDAVSLDDELEALALRLAASSPEAMADLKAAVWEGTDHWDRMLLERAAISGRLVLSDFTRQALDAFARR
jgi:methylglutaconyl-CoA hydratase